MNIERFAVSGFKSFLDRQEIQLKPGVTVIHGENASGKTNLIRAMELTLRLLGRADTFAGLPHITIQTIAHDMGRLFHLRGDGVIRLEVDVALTERDIEEAQIGRLRGVQRISVLLLLAAFGPDKVQIKAERYALADGADGLERKGEASAAEAMADVVFGPRPLLHLPATRRFVPETRDHGGGLIEDQPFQRLQFNLLQSYLATELKHRYRRFASLLSEPPLSIGIVEPTLDIQTGVLGLDLENHTGKLKLPDLASGHKQLILLLGKLLLENGAPIVAIEEPEISLSLSSQHKLFEVFEKLVADVGSPVKQILLESHSEGFEFPRTNPDAVFIDVCHDGVKSTAIVRAGPQRGRYFLPAEEGPVTGTRLTRSGLVRLPNAVRESLGLKPNDPVYFFRNPSGVWELLLEDEFLRRAFPEKSS